MINYQVKSFDDFKRLVKAGKVETTADVAEIIAATFPEGLEAHRYDVYPFSNGGAYIGFNLCRYAYTDRIAAELHCLMDTMKGETGALYGFDFDPYIKTHKPDGERPEWFEVWTG